MCRIKVQKDFKDLLDHYVVSYGAGRHYEDVTSKTFIQTKANQANLQKIYLKF